MARKRISPARQVLEAEYKRQRRRITQFINRAEKRGYQFADNIIPEKPKRITEATVRRLKSLTPEKLYKKAVYGGEATYGEVTSAEEGRKAERREAARKGAETRKANIRDKEEDIERREHTNQVPVRERYNFTDDANFYNRIVISNWYGQLQVFANGEAYALLKRWMDSVLRENGEEATAKMIQDGAEAGNMLNWKVVYKHDEATAYISGMMDYLSEQGVWYKDKMLDKVDFMSRVDEAFEQEIPWEDFDG